MALGSEQSPSAGDGTVAKTVPIHGGSAEGVVPVLHGYGFFPPPPSAPGIRGPGCAVFQTPSVLRTGVLGSLFGQICVGSNG